MKSEIGIGHRKEAVLSNHALPPTSERTPNGPDLDVIDVLVVLLLLQSAVTLLSAVGLLVLAAVTGTPGALGMVGLVAAGPIMLLTIAVGVARRRPWARRGAVIVECVTLLGVNIGLLLDRLPQVNTDLGLAGLLTNVGLPVLVIVLAMSPAVERVTAVRSHQVRRPPAGRA